MHIFCRLTPLDIKVTMGQFDRCFPDVSSTNMSVERIIVHPDFSPGNRAHDLALLKFSTPVKIERRVSPICLATPSKFYFTQLRSDFLIYYKTYPPHSSNTK